jgi:glycosyltransferase involved in cell wall biosynthesis
MGMCTVPHRRKPGDGRHALYMDTTFDMTAKGTLKPFGSAVYRKYEQFEIRSLRAADHVFTVSDCARENLINHYGLSADKVTSVGTGLGSIQPQSGIKDYSPRTVLFVAKQRFEEKGGTLLLDGFRLAQSLDPRMKLIVVATEPYRQRVESIPGTIFKTSLSWDELQALFNSSSLFAMPAVYEPWGLVYLEALVCRTPILGLNRNAVPEFTQNGKNGFLVESPTPASVAEALVEALSDTNRLAAMGETGQQYVHSRYGWDKTAQRICATVFQKSA